MLAFIFLTNCFISLAQRATALVHCDTLKPIDPYGFHFMSYTYNETAIPGSDAAHISFDARLQNALDNSTLACHMAGDGFTAEGSCDYPERGAFGKVNTTISAEKALPWNGNQSAIKIQQWFQCIKSEGERPYTVSVYNYLNIRLNCKSGASSKICSAESSNPLPVDATGLHLDVLYPSPLRNCSKASLSGAKWRIITFEWSFIPLLTHGGHHDPYPFDSTSVGNVVMQLRFDNIDFQYDCYGFNTRLGPINPPKYSQGNTWVQCEANFGRMNAQPETTPTWFSFNWKTFEIRVNQTWTCDDADGGRSNFSGMASTMLKLNCHGISWGGDGQGCTLEEPAIMYPLVESFLLVAS